MMHLHAATIGQMVRDESDGRVLTVREIGKKGGEQIAIDGDQWAYARQLVPVSYSIKALSEGRFEDTEGRPLPPPSGMDAARALTFHLSYGKVEQRTAADTGDVSYVVVLSEHEAAQLLYELTDDKRWLR